MRAISVVASNDLAWAWHSSAPACVLPYFSTKEVDLGWWSLCKILLMLMWVLAPRSTNVGRSTQLPIDMSENLLAHGPAETLKLSHSQTLYPKIKILWPVLMAFSWKLPHLLPTNAIFCGHGNWGLWLKSLYLLESPWKNSAPYD